MRHIGSVRCNLGESLQQCRQALLEQLTTVICASRPTSLSQAPLHPPVTSDCDLSALLHSIYSSKTPRKLSSRSGRCGSRCRCMRCPLKPSGSSWPGQRAWATVDDQASAGPHGADSSHIDFPHHKPPSPSVLAKIRKILDVARAHASYLLHRPWRRR